MKQMERIVIIGCGGSGKSTLAKQLGKKLKLPVVHLDQIYWKENWQHISDEELDQLLTEAANQPKWIIDGNYNRTISTRLEHCDTIIYLDYSRFTCLRGVLKRIITTYGRVRSDMGEGCPERFDLEFLKWVWDFNKKHRKKYHEMLSALEDKTVLIFHSRKECSAFLAGLAE